MNLVSHLDTSSSHEGVCRKPYNLRVRGESGLSYNRAQLPITQGDSATTVSGKDHKVGLVWVVHFWRCGHFWCWVALHTPSFRPWQVNVAPD